MPLYEYSCQRFSQKIELLIRGDEKPVCPHCQSTKLTKLLSVVSGHVSNSGGDPGTGGTCGRPQCGMGGCAGPAAAGAGRHPRCLGTIVWMMLAIWPHTRLVAAAAHCELVPRGTTP